MTYCASNKAGFTQDPLTEAYLASYEIGDVSLLTDISTQMRPCYALTSRRVGLAALTREEALRAAAEYLTVRFIMHYFLAS